MTLLQRTAALACMTALAACSTAGGDTGAGQGGALPDAGPTCTPPDAQPGRGPSGYPLDGWSWVRHGVVLQDAAAAADDGYIAPALVAVGDTLHLWVTRKQGLVHRILHSTSTDGLSFTTPEPTAGLDGQDVIAYPSALFDGTRFLMWYGSGSIDLAASSDGVSWSMVASGVLGPGGAGAFDSLTVLYPSVVSRNPGYTMMYTGFDGQRFAIGAALSQDGVLWDRPVATPLLEHGVAGEFDNHAVAMPCGVSSGPRLLLWYGGYDTSQTDPGPYRVGLASSVDGVSFQRQGVTLDLEPSGVEAYSTRDPAVTRWQGRWWMGYVGMGDDRRYRILTASSDTCGN